MRTDDDLRLDLGQIVRRERLIAGEIEIVLFSITGPIVTWVPEEKFLHGLRHHMRGVVPDQLERARIVSGEDADRGIMFDRRCEIAKLAVETDSHRLLRQRLGDGLGDVLARHAGLEALRFEPSGNVREICDMNFSPLTPAYRRR